MDMVDARDDSGGGRDDSGRRYFPTYFPSFSLLILSSLDFSPFFLLSFSLFSFFQFFFMNLKSSHMK